MTNSEALLAAFHVRLILVDQIKELQAQDSRFVKLKSETESGQRKDFLVMGDGTVTLGRIR